MTLNIPPDLSGYQALSDKGAASGYAGLGTDARVPLAQTRQQIVRKTANETVTASTTLQNDDHLFIALSANDVWVFDAWLYWGAAGTTIDAKAAFTVPSGATLGWSLAAPDVSTAGDALLTAMDTSGTAISFGTLGSRSGTMVRGFVANGGTAGNLQLQWAQNTSDAGNLILLTGSWLLGTKVA